jgi:hypothetical protein
VIAATPWRALFVTEAKARLGAEGFLAPDAEVALSALVSAGSVHVARFPAIDRCLQGGDFRVAALVEDRSMFVDAQRNVERVWSEWAQELALQHRCG